MPTVAPYLIPWDKDGNIMPFSKPNWMRPANVPEAAEWRPREPFPATLTLVEVRRHRAAQVFYWRDQDGRLFPMWPLDMRDMILSGAVIEKATVTGQWVGIRRGENYGIHWAGQ
jgi:hypothetical protein